MNDQEALLELLRRTMIHLLASFPDAPEAIQTTLDDLLSAAEGTIYESQRMLH